MTRILFWLALAFLVVAAIRSKLRAAARAQQMRDDPHRAAERVAAERAAAAAAHAQAQARTPQAQARARARAAAVAEAETMLSCGHCGVYFPASEAVRRDGQDYCSQAHALAPAQPPAP